MPFVAPLRFQLTGFFPASSSGFCAFDGSPLKSDVLGLVGLFPFSPLAVDFRGFETAVRLIAPLVVFGRSHEEFTVAGRLSSDLARLVSFSPGGSLLAIGFFEFI